MIDVKIENISKSYLKGSVKALSSVSIEVNKGELFGIIGPDGAGKTTLFRLLTTLLLPDSGNAFVKNFSIVDDYKSIRKIVGYMPGKFSLYQDLTVIENINFFATVFGTTLEKNYDTIKEIYVQIEPFKNRLAGKLSGGMKQKLALCCALVHEPQVLFLDEPTTGVDPVSRIEFWDMLERLKQKGITILVSTPYMDEASRCDRVALMQKGKVMEIDTLKELLHKYKEVMWSLKSEDLYPLLLDSRKYPNTETCYAFGESNHLTLKSNIDEPQNVTDFLHKLGHKSVEVEKIYPNFEDIFMKLMKKSE